MSFLDDLLGGGQQRQEYEDFVDRYQRGQPWEGISGQEAHDRYQQVVRQLPRDDYMQAAQESFSRLTPEQRRQFARMLQEQARQQQVDFPDLNRDGFDDRMQDPSELARVTSRMEEQRPGLLEQLLGGGGRGGGVGEMLDNPLAKAALAGIAAMAAQRFLGGGGRPRPGPSDEMPSGNIL